MILRTWSKCSGTPHTICALRIKTTVYPRAPTAMRMQYPRRYRSVLVSVDVTPRRSCVPIAYRDAACPQLAFARTTCDGMAEASAPLLSKPSQPGKQAKTDIRTHTQTERQRERGNRTTVQTYTLCWPMVEAYISMHRYWRLVATVHAVPQTVHDLLMYTHHGASTCAAGRTAASCNAVVCTILCTMPTDAPCVGGRVGAQSPS